MNNMFHCQLSSICSHKGILEPCTGWTPWHKQQPSVGCRWNARSRMSAGTRDR